MYPTTRLVSLSGLDVAYLPQRGDQPEVDLIMTIGTRRIPIEIKYRRRVDDGDARALTAFMDQGTNGAAFGLMVTQGDVAGGGRGGATEGARGVSRGGDRRVVRVGVGDLLLVR